jgi:hypothetical protein
LIDVNNVVGFPSNRSPVESRAVVCDPRGRILLVHSTPDLWILPGSSVDAGQTPAEAAVATIKGTPPIDGELFGVFTTRPPDERLIIAYKFESPVDVIEEGLFLPIGLAPMNTDPRHLAIAGHALSGQSSGERLDHSSPTEHLADLRRDEGIMEYDSSRNVQLLESVVGPLVVPGIDRARQMLRTSEVLIACGETTRGGQVMRTLLSESWVDEVTALRCELRLEELDDPLGFLVGAWSRLSRATEIAGALHADLILAHLGFAAQRRQRTREAEAYLRRAMALCDEPGLQATLRLSLATRSTRLISVSA